MNSAFRSMTYRFQDLCRPISGGFLSVAADEFVGVGSSERVVIIVARDSTSQRRKLSARQ
jgi:hypothetical protein